MSKIYSIGYASCYYTLWRVFPQRLVDSSGLKTILTYEFIKNISKDRFEVKRRFPNISIDETIKGTSTFTTVLDDSSPWILKSGKYCGQSIVNVAAHDPEYLFFIYPNTIGALRDALYKLPCVRKRFELKPVHQNHVDVSSGLLRLKFESSNVGNLVGKENVANSVSDLGCSTNVILLSDKWVIERGVVMPMVSGRCRDVRNKEFVIDVDVVNTVQTQYNKTYYVVEHE